MAGYLPCLLFSHFIVYSLAIKLLHSPATKQEILFAERLLDFYCRTESNVYDPSIEIFSLHAHLHLAYQVRLHGDLAHTSAFAFESMIRYIKKKVRGSYNPASQIAYWINMRRATQSNKYSVPTRTRPAQLILAVTAQSCYSENELSWSGPSTNRSSHECNLKYVYTKSN